MWTAGGDGAGFGWPGFGGFGSGAGAPGVAGDVTALAQQYWAALGQAMRAAGAGGTPPQDPWRAAMAQWAQLAGGGQRSDAADVAERFSAQARQWFATMQDVAGRFAGQPASAADIAAAWKQAMGGGADPFGGPVRRNRWRRPARLRGMAGAGRTAAAPAVRRPGRGLRWRRAWRPCARVAWPGCRCRPSASPVSTRNAGRGWVRRNWRCSRPRTTTSG